ncbi:MFS transporter [Paraburkholderia tropica]|uniref:MFS transporter n=1 Tax=Paraburkholderia tropica TaxID=92647 RepID=UPI002AB793B9|nr:MFS transporter [Paraburkholderia tropica]
MNETHNSSDLTVSDAVRGGIEPASASTCAPSMMRIAFASMIGATLEWYDFILYNAMAALVFNALFFPSFDPLIGTVLAFSTYAVGYVSRPVGGVVFGWAGNRFGRKAVLLVTLFVMGLSSLAIGILPTYESVGIAAPLMLVILRFLQGMALGGDWAAAVLLAAENGDQKKRGLNASFAQVGPAAGTLLATGTLWIVTANTSHSGFQEYGWRIPFTLSALLVIAGLWVRRTIVETPVASAGASKRVRSPIRAVFRHHKRSLLVAGGMRIGTDVLYALLATFSLTYVSQILHLPKSLALSGVLAGAVAQLFLVPMFGTLSDKIGQRVIYAVGALAGIVSAACMFWLLDTRNPTLIVVALIFGLSAHAAMYGVQSALVTRQFDEGVRFAGSSLAYTFAGVVGGGFAPLIITALYSHFSSTASISAYVIASLILTLACLRLAR